jgi:aryl-alcohol dehydrogenase-like predicted oxidoreductase
MLRLGVDRVDTVLAPSATDLFQPLGGALWDRLRALKDAGVCKRIGVPMYASDDPVGVARHFRPDVVQAPASLLDQRLLLDGSLATIADMGIEVHLRAIFLNGVLFLPPDRAPSHLRAAAGRISRARRLIAEGRSDPLQAALGFALSRPEASAVLVAAATAAEMSAVVAAALSPPPDLDWDEMAIDDPEALKWAAA